MFVSEYSHSGSEESSSVFGSCVLIAHSADLWPTSSSSCSGYSFSSSTTSSSFSSSSSSSGSGSGHWPGFSTSPVL